MTWKQTIGRVAPVCILLAGCMTGKPVTTTSHVTLGKGQSVEYYRLVNVDPQGRAEFRDCSPIDGSLIRNDNPTVVTAGQKWGGTVETRDKVRDYEYNLEGTDPAKQQVTVLTKITTTRK